MKKRWSLFEIKLNLIDKAVDKDTQIVWNQIESLIMEHIHKKMETKERIWESYIFGEGACFRNANSFLSTICFGTAY